MRCLVIDDNPDDRALVARIVTGHGHRATCVSGGKDALAVLEHERFDVALVDLRMADMSGEQTLRALKKRDRSMRLLVVSGCDDRQHILAAIMAGADGYLLKDELSGDISRALQDVCAGKSPLDGKVAATVLSHVKRLGSEPPEPRDKEQASVVLGRLPRLKPKNEN